MGFFDSFKKKEKKTYQTAVFPNSDSDFSQFGESIYASDVVQNAIDVIATECSKMQPKHIVINAEGVRTEPSSSINQLFRVAPNPMMTTKDFIEKIMWLLYLNYNAFIYPVYEIYKDAKQTSRKRYTAFYPLNPNQVSFERDPAGKLYCHFYFDRGYDVQIPYDEIIHLRKKFSVNDIMGGGYSGQPDNAALLKVLETNDIILQGMGKAVKSSLQIRAVLNINTILDDASTAEKIKEFEALLAAGENAIAPLDLKGDIKELKIDPKFVDKDSMQFLDDKVLRWFGVSRAIMDGDFNDEQYQAFYEKTLEPLLISLGQAFTKTLFSDREIAVGNQIIVYQKNMMYLSTDKRLDMVKVGGEQGLLSDDEKRELLGFTPKGGEEGARITQSLNFVNVNLVDKYQLGKLGSKGGKEDE